MTVKERITALREVMAEKKIDAYLVPTDDFHASEYVGEYFKCRKYITGFTGSAGRAVIMQDMAGLWTDGRYFIQAAAQLEGTGVELFKMGEPDVPTVHQFLEEKLGEGMCLGFDGRTVSAEEADELTELLAKKGATLQTDSDLVGEIWEDRPALSCEPVMELDVKWAGESRADKCARIRKSMEEKGADGFVLTSLDDIAWLLNIRGGDVHCCPVVLSYLIMTKTEIRLFANEKAFSASILDALSKDGVTILPYDSIYEYVKTFEKDMTVLLCKKKANCRLVNSIPKEVTILDEANLTFLPKSIKNPVEVENERIAHIKDGVALTKFICWLKKNVGKIPMTEYSAAMYLDHLRSEIDGYLDLSFPTISAYGTNAAMMHYEATEDNCAALAPEGMLLVDSGGQYLGGTTDVTRTIVLGPVSQTIKEHYTAVAKGMLQLTDAKFLYGCTGRNLDILARQPMWDQNIDYKCGTGHGVGYILNVHEGPQGIRWRFTGNQKEVPIEAGMDVTNEPGVYIEGSHGIRIENVMVARNGVKNGDGQFMYFDTLTWAPIDLDAIDVSVMERKDIERLNRYHAQVREKMAPYLNEEEAAWLKEATRAI